MLVTSLLVAGALAGPLPVRVEMDQEVVLDQPTDDVFGMGQRVSVRGGVADNAFLMGEELVVEAPVDGDLFSMGEEVRIRSAVAGDLYALAGDVVIEPTGSVAGHVHSFGGDVRIEGPVGGDLSVGAGVLTLRAPVAGSVQAEVGELVVGDGAAIGGDLSYRAPAPLPELEQRVAGTVTWTEPIAEEIESIEAEPAPGLLSSIVRFGLWKAWGYGTKLLVGGVLLLLGGAAAGRISRTLVDQPSRSLGIGFTAASALLMGSLLAIFTVLPFPLGLVGLTLLGLGLYLGQLVAAQALGDLVLKRFRPEAWGSPFLSMAVGLVPLVLVYALPWVGWVAWFAATMFGLGAIWLHLRSPAATA